MRSSLGRIRRRDRRDGISQRRNDYCGPAKADDVGYSIQQHLGEEVEGLDLSMDSVSNATPPSQTSRRPWALLVSSGRRAPCSWREPRMTGQHTSCFTASYWTKDDTVPVEGVAPVA